MKILLDESIPQKLRKDFTSEHEIWTVRDKGWLGKKNGELLRLLSDQGFDLFVTVDRKLPYQHKIENLTVPIIVMCAKDNRHQTLGALVPKIFKLLSQFPTSKILEVK